MKTIFLTLIAGVSALILNAQNEPADTNSAVKGATNYAIGSLPGNFSVSSSGAAIYTIPLDMPPGRMGMVPQLAFVYNSQQNFANVMGKGWGLTGFSAITRTNRTLYYNGDNDNVDFDGDELLLDGKHMVKISESSGQKEYRIETDPSVKVVELTGNYGNYFKVYQSNGTIQEYGNSETCRQVHGNTSNPPLAWHINKAYDLKGNNIVYDYYGFINAGELHPVSIYYTGNEYTKSLGGTKISFEYNTIAQELRQTSYYSYNNQTYLNTTQLLLSAINITNDDGSAGIFRYDIGYDYDKGVCKEMFLKTISKTIWKNGLEFTLAPTTFNWEFYEAQNEIEDGQSFIENIHRTSKPNIVSLNIPTLAHNPVAVSMKRLDDPQAFDDYTSIVKIIGYNNEIGITEDIVLNQMTAYDADGDGQDELLFVDGDGIKVYKFDPGAGSFAQIFFADIHTHKIIPADVSGDGLNDLLLIFNNKCQVFIGKLVNGTVSYSLSQYELPISSPENIKGVADINGDNDFEICYQNYPKHQYYIYSFSTVGGFTQWNQYLYFADNNIDKQVHIADFNGDGKSDFCYFYKEAGFFKNKMRFSTGNSFTPETDGYYYSSNLPYLMEDFNNDNKCDFLSLSSNSTGLLLNFEFTQNNGLSLTSKNTTLKVNAPEFDKLDIFPLDYEANGITDFALLYSNTVSIGQRLAVFKEISILFSKQTGNISDIIHTITDGNLVTRTIEYSLNSRKKTSENNFPVSIIPQRATVVSQTWINGAGTQKWDHFSYKYYKALTHCSGIGFLGFSEQEIINQTDRLKTTTVNQLFNTEFGYFTLFPKTIKQYSLKSDNTNDKLLSETTNDYNIKPTNQNFPKLHLGVITKSVTKKWDNDTNHSYMGITVKVQKPEKIDNYGNNLESLTYSDEIATSDLELMTFNWQTINKTRYWRPDLTHWLISQPFLITRKTIHNDNETGIVNKDIQQSVILYHDDPADTRWPFVRLIQTIPNEDITKKTELWFDDYDIYGNIKSKILKTVVNGNVEEKKETYEYALDNKYYGRFITKKTVFDEVPENNLIETYLYDYLTGQLASSTNHINLTTSFEYDHLGNVKKTSLPDGTFIINEIERLTPDKLPVVEETEVGETNMYRLTYKGFVQNSEKWNSTIELFDKYGRTIRSKSQRLNGNWSVVGATYDDKGRIQTTSEPHANGSQPDLFTTFSYDAIGRMYQTTLPTGAVIKTDFKGLTAKTSNQSTNQWKQQTVDAAGNTVKVTDPTGDIVYVYNAAGQPTKITTQGNDVIMKYDNAGYNLNTTTADMGMVSYIYNNFGQLTSQTDERQNNIIMNYDQIGRLKRRTVMPDNERSEYFYCQHNENGFGNIKTITKTLANGDIIITFMTYDNIGRTKTKTEIIDRQTFTYIYDYHPVTGMLQYLTYPVTNYKIRYDYNSVGHLYKIVENSTGKVLWKAQTDNERGQITSFTLGNGLYSIHDYDKYGYPLDFQTIKFGKKGEGKSDGGLSPGEEILQHQGFNFDEFTGNLMSKSELTYNYQNLTELYTYDDTKLKERLETWGRAGGTIYSINYNDNGNIQSKSDVTANGGSYIYGNDAGPHAVTRIKNTTPQYRDRFKNHNIKYNGFNKVRYIKPENSASEFEFIYGNNDERIKIEEYTWIKTGLPIRTNYYFDNFEVELSYKMTRFLHYIYGPTGLIAIKEQENEMENTSYIHTDYQGSYSVVTDERGSVIDRLSYDPWGRRRNPGDYSFANVPVPRFNRGYTGHEHLDGLGLINMNGRVYDPALGRFLSPDPIIQNQTNSQNFNAYSYCLNNPLKYTDPSGYNQKPAGWDAPWELTGAGAAFYRSMGSGYNGPGSTNHWSDPYRSKEGNAFLMNQSTFNNIYGDQAYQNMFDKNKKTGDKVTTTNPNDIVNIVDKMKSPFNIYLFFDFGQVTFVSCFGELGNKIIGTDGGISFSNPSGMFVVGAEAIASGGGVNEANVGVLPLFMMVGATLYELGSGALIGLSRLSLPLSLLTLQGDTRTGNKWRRREDKRGQQLERNILKGHNNMLNNGGVNNQGFPGDPNGLIPKGGAGLFVAIKAMELYFNWKETIQPQPNPYAPIIINRDTSTIVVPYSPGFKP